MVSTRERGVAITLHTMSIVRDTIMDTDVLGGEVLRIGNDC